MTTEQAVARRELLAIPMATESTDIYSGVARAARTLWATRWSADPDADTVAVFLHPSSNFLGHYALQPMAEYGIDTVGMTTRYLGNDSAMLLENCIVDVGSCVTHLRELGYRRIVLVGNSGGGELAAMYQGQSEHPTITSSPCGGGPDLTQAALPGVDGLVLLNAHIGRAVILTESMDAAVRDEADPFDRDPSLDVFAEDNGPPFDTAFVERYRAAQVARNHRITDWVESRWAYLREHEPRVADLPFVVQGTFADPRMLDLAVEPSDRALGSLWGDVRAANFSPATLAHHTSLRAWLSQWSLRRTNGDARAALPHVSVPVLVMYGTADQGCHPSHARALFDAVPHDRRQLAAIQGGTHYFRDQPELVAQVCTQLDDWIRAEL